MNASSRNSASTQNSRPLWKCLSAVTCGLTLAALTGCGAGFQNSASSAASLAVSGSVHGGQQAISGSKIYLYAVNTANDGKGSTSLLNSPGYVQSDANGNFSISGDYTCPANSYVYLLALGGNPGLSGDVNNSSIGLAAGLGACSSLSSSTYVSINEVTTVAMTYALAQFITSETNVAATSTTLTGLQNAFGNIPNLIDTVHGVALATTPAGNGTVPQATLNSIANSLASCVNSDGTGTACEQLFTSSLVTTANGPADTFQSALNIAQNPGNDPSDLYNISTANSPFQPSLTSAPNDFTITIQYSGAANPNLAGKTCYSGTPFTDICQGQGIAIDASGDVWLSNYNPDYNGGNGAVSFEQGSIVEFSPAGVELTPPGGYTASYLYRNQQIAIDQTGNIWVGSRMNANTGTSASLVKFTPSGVASNFTGGGIVTPRAVAIDTFGNVWTAGPGAIAEFTNDGTPVSGTGYQNSNILAAYKMSFDSLGNAWVISFDTGTQAGELIEFTPYAHSTGTFGGNFTQTIATVGGGINEGVAIDSSNNVWYSNFYSTPDDDASGFLSEYSNGGTLLSGSGDTSGGIYYPNDLSIDGKGNVFSIDSSVGEIANNGVGIAPLGGWESPNPNDCCFTAAIDNSGNLWLTGEQYIYQMIGIAAPVVTPIVATLPPLVTATVKPAK